MDIIHQFFKYPQYLGTQGLVSLAIGVILGLRLSSINNWYRRTILQVVLLLVITLFWFISIFGK